MKNIILLVAFLISTYSISAQLKEDTQRFKLAQQYNSSYNVDQETTPALKMQFQNITTPCNKIGINAFNLLGDYVMELVYPNQNNGFLYSNQSNIGLFKNRQNFEMINFQNSTFAIDNYSNLYQVNLVR